MKVLNSRSKIPLNTGFEKDFPFSVPVLQPWHELAAALPLGSRAKGLFRAGAFSRNVGGWQLGALPQPFTTHTEQDCWLVPPALHQSSALGVVLGCFPKDRAFFGNVWASKFLSVALAGM